jgi:hypothetical protein
MGGAASFRAVSSFAAVRADAARVAVALLVVIRAGEREAQSRSYRKYENPSVHK